MTLSLTTLANDVTRYVRNDGGVDYYEIDPSELMKLIAIARCALNVQDFSIHSAFDELKEALEGVTDEAL